MKESFSILHAACLGRKLCLEEPLHKLSPAPLPPPLLGLPSSNLQVVIFEPLSSERVAIPCLPTHRGTMPCSLAERLVIGGALTAANVVGGLSKRPAKLAIILGKCSLELESDEQAKKREKESDTRGYGVLDPVDGTSSRGVLRLLESFKDNDLRDPGPQMAGLTVLVPHLHSRTHLLSQ